MRPELHRLCSAIFRHGQGETWDLHVAGEPVPIVVTRERPFWSADRNAWGPAWQLRPGERLSAGAGLFARERPEPVCCAADRTRMTRILRIRTDQRKSCSDPC